MWLYYCLLSTIIYGFVAIAIKKCSNNDPKRIAMTGILLYQCTMVLVILIINPQILVNLNVLDMIKITPFIASGILVALSIMVIKNKKDDKEKRKLLVL